MSLDIGDGEIGEAEAAHPHVYRHVTNFNFHIIFVDVTNALEEELSPNKRMQDVTCSIVYLPACALHARTCSRCEGQSTCEEAVLCTCMQLLTGMSLLVP